MKFQFVALALAITSTSGVYGISAHADADADPRAIHAAITAAAADDDASSRRLRRSRPAFGSSSSSSGELLAGAGKSASASDEPSTSMFLNEDKESTSMRGLQRRDLDGGDGNGTIPYVFALCLCLCELVYQYQYINVILILSLTFSYSNLSFHVHVAVCGPETDSECVSTLNARSSYTLVKCFEENLPFMDTKVTIVQYFNGPGEDLEVFKLTFPQEDFEKLTKANFNAALGQPRFPAGIFYAEDQEEVIKAVNCAREAGYKVSPRGRGHSFQGLSSMDGYMVIDMSLMCNPDSPDDFISTHFEQPWLLGGGQKAIGSIKTGSGCTNAVMLAYTADEFPEGISNIGSCPSVGITGKFQRASAYVYVISYTDQ